MPRVLPPPCLPFPHLPRDGRDVLKNKPCSLRHAEDAPPPESFVRTHGVAAKRQILLSPLGKEGLLSMTPLHTRLGNSGF